MPEEEAFAVLVKIMSVYNLRELFKPSMAELGLRMYQLEIMIRASDRIFSLCFTPASVLLTSVLRHCCHYLVTEPAGQATCPRLLRSGMGGS